MSPSATFSSVLSNATDDAVDLSTLDPREFHDHETWFRLMVLVV
jgi:hypothetical protein